MQPRPQYFDQGVISFIVAKDSKHTVCIAGT